MHDDSFPAMNGSISLWRFTENVRNYPGWHLSADELGCASLRSLLTSLQSSGGYRTIPTSRPTSTTLSVPNNKGGAAKWTAATKWRIEFAKANSWSFSQSADFAVLALGSSGMADLIRGVTAIATGIGDFCVGDGSQDEVLWFWWQPKTN